MITVVVVTIVIIHSICPGPMDHDSMHAKRFAVYKNVQSLKYIVFEYILIITKGYGVRATTIEGPNAVKGLNSNAVLLRKFHLTEG